jgi:hypothetical protein
MPGDGHYVDYTIEVVEGMVVLDAVCRSRPNMLMTWPCAGTAKQVIVAPVQQK